MESYNLAAQRHVNLSFETVEHTANVDGIGTLRLLEATCMLRLDLRGRSFQASTCEFYGLVQETPQHKRRSIYTALAICHSPTLCILVRGKLS